jgi:hypothetical protein
MKPVMLFAALLLMTVTLSAQRKQKPEIVKSAQERPASDARSFMELFGKVERDWGLAVEKKDMAALDAIIASEFIERDAINPERTVTRAEWIEKNLFDYELDPLTIRAMTIRAFLNNAVVSFVQKRKATQVKPGRAAECFIVDVWVTNHGSWQIASRFVSPTASQTK